MPESGISVLPEAKRTYQEEAVQLSSGKSDFETCWNILYFG